MADNSTSSESRPIWVQELEQAFGGPSQAAFGTAVFFDTNSDLSDLNGENLEQRALTWYQYFCGQTWEKFGPDNWLGNWQSVYTQTAETAPIIDTLASLEDRQARRSASTLFEGHSDPKAAKQALERAFDDSEIEELQVFRIGDGGAMSGIMLAGRRVGGESAYVPFLLD